MAQDYRRLLLVYLALMLLLATTIGATLLDIGPVKPVINIGVAIAKACLVFWFFMQLRDATGLVRLFASAAVCWLLILFFLGSINWLSAG